MENLVQQIHNENEVKESESGKLLSNKNPSADNDRRNFLKKAATGGISLAGFMFLPIEDTIAQITSKVNQFSKPSDLKITDLRYATVMHLGRPVTLLRIDTDQDIYGLGEVRDGGDKRHALMLKSRILGQNPSNVEKIFKSIKQYGGHGRNGGGVSGIEMALWDLAGKAYGVPCWMLLGGKYRDRVRLYADTHGDKNIDLIKEKVKRRVHEEGFTWLKMTRLRNLGLGSSSSYINSTSSQLTEEGIQKIVAYIETIRNFVGNQIPISADHFGDSSVNNIIRLGKALDPYRLAWMEEPVNWKYPRQLKTVSDAIDTPIATGEDIYLKETFIELCDACAVDIVHPDLATAGGILETKKIGDYAQEKGIGMAQHYAGTPISFMANVHCAAATENASVLEFHPEAGEQITNWINMATRTDGQPLIINGFANVPDSPGLGIEINEDGVKRILNPEDKSYFAPTSEWK